MIMKFVGDWKVLKDFGFTYNKHTSIIYFYDGVDGEWEYSNTMIRKSGGIVQISQGTRVLFEILSFLDTYEKVYGLVPDCVCFNRDTGEVTSDKEAVCTKLGFQKVYVEEEGIDTLLSMFRKGLLVKLQGE